MSRTTDVQHNIGCPVCGEGISYIGNLDKTKTFETDKVKADSVLTLTNEGFYATDGKYVGVEVIVTCPSCQSSIKTTNAAKLL